MDESVVSIDMFKFVCNIDVGMQLDVVTEL